jgi:hypothetical protein
LVIYTVDSIPNQSVGTNTFVPLRFPYLAASTLIVRTADSIPNQSVGANTFFPLRFPYLAAETLLGVSAGIAVPNESIGTHTLVPLWFPILTSGTVVYNTSADHSIPEGSSWATALTVDNTLAWWAAETRESVPVQTIRTDTSVKSWVIDLASNTCDASTTIPVSSSTGNTTLGESIIESSLGTVSPTLVVVPHGISRTGIAGSSGE